MSREDFRLKQPPKPEPEPEPVKPAVVKSQEPKEPKAPESKKEVAPEGDPKK